jgi:hypothetical protein
MKVNIPKIEAERKRTGENKKVFSSRLGLKLSAYIKMQRSESTTIKTLAKIGAALHVDPRDLLTR